MEEFITIILPNIIVLRENFMHVFIFQEKDRKKQVRQLTISIENPGPSEYNLDALNVELLDIGEEINTFPDVESRKSVLRRKFSSLVNLNIQEIMTNIQDLVVSRTSIELGDLFRAKKKGLGKIYHATLIIENDKSVQVYIYIYIPYIYSLYL